MIKEKKNNDILAKKLLQELTLSMQKEFQSKKQYILEEKINVKQKYNLQRH